MNKCGLPEAAGLELIAGLAEGNRRLNFLGLANNSLGSKTAAALGELLAVNRSLREVDLSWNQIKVGLGFGARGNTFCGVLGVGQGAQAATTQAAPVQTARSC